MANTVNEFRIGQNTSERLVPIIVNKYDDKIYIDINNTTFVNRIISLYQWFESKQVEIEKLSAELQNTEVSEPNMDSLADITGRLTAMYQEICDRFDIVFGAGTIRKYFRELYEAIGDDFIPDDECIEDFIDEITPVVNKLFELRDNRIRRKYNKKKKRTHTKTKQELIDEAIKKREENA